MDNNNSIMECIKNFKEVKILGIENYFFKRFQINQERYNHPIGRFFARLENGENLLDVYNRVSLFVTTRLERSDEKNNIIVTHGNTMKIFKMFLLNEKVESFEEHKGPYPNACVMHFVYDDENLSYNFLGLL